MTEHPLRALSNEWCTSRIYILYILYKKVLTYINFLFSFKSTLLLRFYELLLATSVGCNIFFLYSDDES